MQLPGQLPLGIGRHNGDNGLMSESRPPSSPRLAIPPQRSEPLPQCTPPDPEHPIRAKRIESLLASRSFRRADADIDFLQGEQLRHIRLGLEYLKPELSLQKQKVTSTVVIFGGTRIVERAEADQRLQAARRRAALDPMNASAQSAARRAERIAAKSHYYDVAREFARQISERRSDVAVPQQWVVTTGGGPGVMEAGNRGAFDAGRSSIGLNIALPMEQFPNAYVSPDLCFQFRYFALRKLHFLKRARALVAFPGGFGTLDEIFDALCLIQTRKIPPMPVVLVGKEFWQRVLNIDFLLEEGVIAEEDVQLVQWAETAEEIVDILDAFYSDDEPQPESPPTP